MLILDLWKNLDDKKICVSKKLGLFLKNPDESLYDYIYEKVKDDYTKSRLANRKNKIIKHMNDCYYKCEVSQRISKCTSLKKILAIISQNVVILEAEVSDQTIIIDDTIFESANEEEIRQCLRSSPLLNPDNEYEIEYKILFLFNFLRGNSIKRNSIDVSYNTGYPYEYEKTYILDNMFFKTFMGRKKHRYWGYKYYSDTVEEFNLKTSDLIKLGNKIDNYIDNVDDFWKLDFIIETLLYADNNMYALLNYVQLIEMLIINPRCSTREQFKIKIKNFINISDFENEENIEKFSTLLYDIRSKLIHGDFKNLIKNLMSFNKLFNQEYSFDFGEAKEVNWILSTVNYRLRDIIREVVNMMLEDKAELYNFKMDELNEI